MKDNPHKDPWASYMPADVPYKRASLQGHPEYTRVRIGDVIIGGDELVVVAGPCAIEGTEGALEIARAVKEYGADLFRGGAFKPRTSPYAFQGLGDDALQVFDHIRRDTGLGVVSEVMSIAQADRMAEHVDVLQVGSRNVHNYEMLKCVGRMGKPVILKRGFATTVEEWLLSAEYILAEGNDQVVLCERGIRTFEPSTRNTLDLSAVALLKTLTHLPVMVDPSHATGLRELVIPMARAAVAAGADALMVEVHTNPDEALSDGRQSILPGQFEQLMREVRRISPIIRENNVVECSRE